MATGTRDARLNFRLPSDLKEVIEEAAASLGQSVSEFAVSTLVRQARAVVEQRNVTVLSDRDRARFIALLDDAGANPTPRLSRLPRGTGSILAKTRGEDWTIERLGSSHNRTKFDCGDPLDDPNHLFLSMGVIRKLNLPPIEG